MICFEALNAKHGDALLLRYRDDGGEERLWMIDGGPAGVHKGALRPRLDELRGEADSLRIDLAMVSHIDDDHINGVLQLTRGLVGLKDAGKPLPLEIQRFWHNGFDDILGGDPSALGPAMRAASLAASTGDWSEVADRFGIKGHAAQLVLSSVGQGKALLADLGSLGITPNEPMGGLIAAPGTVTVDGATLAILGPLKNRLDDLRRDWALATARKDSARLAELFSEDRDESVPNLSSLAMLVEVGGRRILLTGDARGDDLVAGWVAAGRDPRTPFPVDILKMPHHGSDRNLTPEFLALFPADHYVISADGKHHNPDERTLRGMAEIIGDRACTIHFTNRTPAMKPALGFLESEARKPNRRFSIAFRPSDDVSLRIELSRR
jgi:hypothetical protein